MLPSFVNESLEVVMNVHDAFMKGWNEAAGIMKHNGLKPSNKTCAVVCEMEEIARDFSPFESTAKAFNDAENSDELWEAYERGIQTACTYIPTRPEVHQDVLGGVSVGDYVLARNTPRMRVVGIKPGTRGRLLNAYDGMYTVEFDGIARPVPASSIERDTDTTFAVTFAPRGEWTRATEHFIYFAQAHEARRLAFAQGEWPYINELR